MKMITSQMCAEICRGNVGKWMEMGVGDAIISLPQGRTILVCAVKGGWKGGCLASNEFIPN